MIHYIEYDPETGEGHEIDPFKRPDIVAVVRCRDCKHFTDDEMEYYHYCGNWCEQVEPDGFCSRGEKK